MKNISSLIICFFCFQILYSQNIPESEIAGVWEISGIKFNNPDMETTVKKDLKLIFKKATLIFNGDKTFNIIFNKKAPELLTKKYAPENEFWILQDGYISIGNKKNHYSTLNFGIKEDKSIYFTLYGMDLKVAKTKGFKITAPKNLEDNLTLTEVENDVIPFVAIEQVPLSRACDPRINSGTKKKCTSRAIAWHFMRKFDTDLMAEVDFEGLVTIETSFVIDKNGVVKDIFATGGPELFNEHAVDVTEQLPLFIPGYLEGKEVEVSYTMPIKFQIVN